MTARLSLYTIYDTADIRIDGHSVPLEYDQTAVRALFAVEGKGWTRELSGLLNNALAGPAGSESHPLAVAHEALAPQLHHLQRRLDSAERNYRRERARRRLESWSA